MGKYKRKTRNFIDRVVVLLLTVAMITTSSHIPVILANSEGSPATASQPISISNENSNEDNDASEIDLLDLRTANLESDDEDEYPNALTEGIFRYIVKEDGTVSIVGLIDGNTDTSITIPDVIDGKNVTEIEHRAFYFKNLTTVTLGSNIVKIGDYAFAGNDLTTIAFPDSVKEIAEGAFRDNNLNNLNLNKIEKVGAQAFAGNEISNLSLGDSLIEIGDGGFKNNSIESVTIPDTLTTVGEDILANNKKFVNVVSTADPLKIPPIQKTKKSYGYIINPITINVSYVDNETGNALLDPAVLGTDLTSSTDVFAKNIANTYTPPAIEGYEPVLEDGAADGDIRFTPDVDGYNLIVKYRKRQNGLVLKQDPANKPILEVNATDVEEKLKSLIIATNAAGENLRDKVQIEPSTIDTSISGKSHKVRYTLTDETTGEVKRLTLDVFVGTNMNDFPIGNDWVLGDFVYGTGTNANKVYGLSPQGSAKADGNKDLVLPHINPITGDRITVVGGTTGVKFNTKKFETIKDFDGNIEEIYSETFKNINTLNKVELPNVKVIGNSAFNGDSKLEEFDFGNVEEVRYAAFQNTGLKKLIAPKLKKIESSAFSHTKIGEDTDYPQGIYLPEWSISGESIFYYAKLTNINAKEQFPKLAEIPSNVFSYNNIVSADLTGVTKVGYSAFYSQGSGKNLLTSLIGPDILSIGSFAFYQNGLVELKLPKVEKIDNYAFYYSSKLTKLEAPELISIGSSAFYSNSLNSLDLPKLRVIGESAFSSGLIKEAKLPEIETIGRNAFYNSNYSDGNNDGIPDYNPGLRSLGNLIPIYTKENTTASSNENYIINPPDETYQGEYEEDDFTWDANDPNKVTGFTNKGKLKLYGNGYKLKLPDKVTSVADSAFRWVKLKSVEGKNVTTVGDYSFDTNPLSSVDMPNLTTIGNYAFYNNIAAEGSKLSRINLDNVRVIGNSAFSSAGLEGVVSIPNVEVVNDWAFYNNKISKVNAPLLKEIKSYAFYTNMLSKLDAEQFPLLEKIGSQAFMSNYIESIELPSLKRIDGSSNFSFYDSFKPVIWTIPPNLTVGDNSSFQSNLFNRITAGKKPSDIRNAEPGGIILSNPPNEDGTLNRTALPYKEQYKKESYYNGKYIPTTYRNLIFDPSTVKVNYRLVTGESFDGADGRPNRPDFREYMYEEKERDVATGLLPTSKKYIAPEFEDYVLVSSTDSTGTVEGRKEITLPYEAQGARTDREITFTYKKIEFENLSGPKLSYGIADPTGVITSQLGEYTANSPYSGSLLPQMLTSFSIEEVKEPIKKGKIKISIDSPYIDMNSINVSTSDVTKQWYKSDAIKVVDGGIEIDLNPNIPAGSAIRNIVIGYRFKSDETPEGAKANLKMRLWDKDDTGEDKVIAQSKNIELNLSYTPAPSITVKAPLNIKNYAYTGLREEDNAPRYVGEFEPNGDTHTIVSNPSYYLPYKYEIGNIYYKIDEVKLKTVLPTYIAIENGVEVKKTAVFDAAANPNWTLSEDGTTVTSVTRFSPSRETYEINKRLPKLNLKFPGLKENSNIINKTYAEISPYRSPQDLENVGKTVRATGDFGEGDQHLMYVPKMEIPEPKKGDIGFSKYSEPLYNAYIYDYDKDKKKEIVYRLFSTATNETLDLKNVSVIDYDLDSRLKYTGIRFENTAASVGNMEVLIRAYKKVADNINPTGDRVVFEATVPINNTRGVAIPDIDIDYLKIDYLGTDIKPFDKSITIKVVTKLKNPDEKLFSDAEGINTNILENKAMLVGDTYKKGTDQIFTNKNSDPKYDNLNYSYISESKAKFDIRDYKVNVKVMKSLSHDSNPNNYKRFPALESGEIVIAGQKGAYHIMLDSKLEGSTGDRADKVLNNLKIIDILPKGLKINSSDVTLDPYFLRTGGHFRILDDYDTIENGRNVKRTAIEFTAPKYDMNIYYKDDIKQPLRIAVVETEYTGEALNPILTNKVYASWDAQNVNVVSPAQNRQKDAYLDPHGVAIPNDGQLYSYDEVSSKVTTASGIVAKEFIRNKIDNIWQDETPTGSGEPFDYKMRITNYASGEASVPYKGIDIINVFPGVADYKLNKTGLRGSEFENTIDLARVATELKIPEGYKVTFLNTDTSAKELLEGRNMDELVKDTSLVWSDAPAANTKMLRVTAIGDKQLSGGEEIEINIPMKAPQFTGFENPIVGKKAVDSFVIRHYDVGTTNYRDFSEPNSVFNYMTLPKGSISFTKRAKIGKNAQNSTAIPLEGAGFELVDTSVSPNKVIAVSYSDNTGKVKFDDLNINKRYTIREFMAPEGYVLSDSTINIGPENFKKVKDDGYNYEVNRTEEDRIINIKPISGTINIRKTALDTTPLSNISFIISGEDKSNNTIREELMTDDTGSISINNLPEGRYKISEIESAAVNRYQKAPDKRVEIKSGSTDVTVDFVNDKFQVLFRKLFVDTENLLDVANWDTLTDFGKKRGTGYKFKVEGDGQTFTTAPTNNLGEVILQNLKTEVEYKVTELPMSEQSSTTKSLYKHNAREYRFKITNNGKFVNLENNAQFKQYSLNIPNIQKDIVGEIKVKKTDDSTPARALEGAKFAVYKIELDNEGNIASSTKIGEETTAIEGNDAIAKFTNLRPGLYQVKEEVPPAGYGLSKVVYEVTVPDKIVDSMATDNAYDKSDDNTIIYRTEKVFTNTSTKVEGVKGADVEGYKNVSESVAKDYVERKKATIPNITYRVTGKGIATVYIPLQGVKFELYKLVDGEKSGSAIPIDGNTDIITDNEGKINFGSYKFEFESEYGLYEKEALDGYKPITTAKHINLSEEAKKPGFKGTYSFYINNDVRQGSILVSKYDSIQRKSLLGASFAIYKGTTATADYTKPLKTIVTGTDGIAFFDKLPYGNYVLREISAPADYKQPEVATRDIDIEINSTAPYYKKVVFNVKLIDIDVKKKWSEGSEASVNVRMLRSLSRNNIKQNGTPVVIAGLTDEHGIVVLNAANEWKTKFTNLELADADGRPYYYQVDEVGVDENLYTSVITGTKETGFTITNTATDTNKTQIGVTKNWEFTDGREVPEGTKVNVVLKKVTSGARLPITDTDTTVDVETVTLSAENNWQYLFTNLPKRENGQDIVYRVEEVGSVAGFEKPTYTYDDATKNMTIVNKAVDRNIVVEKKWVNVDPTQAPEVLVQLFDKDDMTNPIATKSLELENNKYLAKFTNVPSCTYTVDENGNIVAKKIQYALREKYADNRVRVAYTTTTDMNDAKFADYGQDANMGADINAIITNTLEVQNIILNKTWVGVDSANAPAVRMQIVDVTDDTTTDLSEETVHKNVGAAITLDNANNFTATVQDLPKYRPDGITEIKYIAKELNSMAGYKYTYTVNRGEDNNITINATNTREKVELNLSKTWHDVDSLYTGVEQTHPSVKAHIWADDTNDNTYNPTELTNLGVVELNATNRYKASLRGLNKYAADGITEIKYYVKEEALTGYTNNNAPDDGSGILFSLDAETGILKANIENTEEKLDIAVEKRWVGLDKYTDEQRANLPTVNVDLYDVTDSDNEMLITGRTANLELDTTDTSNSTYKTTFTDLPKYKYDNQGNAVEIVYGVKERQAANLSGYDVTYTTDTKNAKYTITNTVKEKEISVSKTWVGKEEASIELKLKKNDAYFKTVTVTKNTSGNNDYTYKFTGLPYYEIDGTTEITYAVEETPMSGYSTDIVRTEVPIDNSVLTKSEFVITNTYNTVKLDVSKTWTGVEGENAPPITVQVVDETDRDNVEIVAGKTATLNSDNNFKFTFNALPKFKADGVTPIKYSAIEEPSLVGYEFNVLRKEFKAENTLSEEDRLNAPFGKWEVDISNTRVTQDLVVKKTWTDDESGYTRPNVVFDLFADETDDGNDNASLIGTYTLSASENPNENFTMKLNKPKYAADGVSLIKYYAQEREVAGYTGTEGKVELVANAENTALEATFTNTLKTRNVLVEKTWEGIDKYTATAKANLPEVHVRLLDVTDETNPITVREEKALVEDNGVWKASYENLPYYKQDGITEIKYAVKEVEENSLVGYAVAYAQAQAEGNNLKLGITNTVKTIPITIAKVWVGVEANLAPQITLNLTSTDTSINLTDKSVVLNNTNGFTQTIVNMPKYNIDGVTLAQYNVSEATNLSGYTFSTNPGLNGVTNTSLSITATNTRVLRPIKLKKTWADDLSGYTKPDVTFRLYKNTANDADTAIEVGSYTLSNNTNPSFVVTAQVPKYAEDGTSELFYYVSEDAVAGYNTPEGRKALVLEDEVLNVSLENSLKVRDVNIEKTFEGLDLYTKAEQAKLPNVDVELYDVTDINNPIKVRETKRLTLDTADGKYKAKYDKLPEFKENGTTPIVYKVQEVRTESLVGYVTTYATPVVDANNNITQGIKNTVNTVSIKAKKEWTRTDVANAPEVRLALRANKTGVDLTDKEVDLNVGNDFEGSFGNLPKYTIDGKAIEYSLEELNNKQGYTFKQASEAGIADISLTGTNERVVANAHLQKTWAQDLSGYTRPNVTFKLYKSGDGTNFTEVNSIHAVDNSEEAIGDAGNIVLSNANNWSVNIANLPRFEEDGVTPITYYVGEEPIAGYKEIEKVKLSADALDKNNLSASIENELITRNVFVEKTWSGLDAYNLEALAKLPNVEVSLYDVTNGEHTKVRETKILNRENTVWTTKFDNLPYYKEDGTTEIVYKVEESTSLKGYEVTYNNSLVGNDIKFNITNTAKTIKVNAKKLWQGVDPALAPNVSLALIDKANLGDVNLGNKKFALSQTNAWADVLVDLPKYHIDGNTLVDYGLYEENTKPGYEFSYTSSLNDLGDELSFEATNTRVRRAISLKKIWAGSTSKYARPSVTFNIYKKATGSDYEPAYFEQNGENTNKLVLDGSENYEATIEGFAKYDESGQNLIHYYVKEDPVPGYIIPENYIELLPTESNDTLYGEVRNVLATMNIEVTKKFYGLEVYSSEELKKLAKVSVSLYDVTNGQRKLVETLPIVDVDGELRAIFKDVPKFKEDGLTEIEYEVKEPEEDKLSGYKVYYGDKEVDENGNISFTISNVVRTRNITIEKTWKTPPFLVNEVRINLLKDGIKVGEPIILNGKEETPWTTTVTNLPYYEADGITLINYSVKEEETLGYRANISVKEVQIDPDNAKYTNLAFDVHNVFVGNVSGGNGGGGSIGGGIVNRFIEQPGPNVSQEKIQISNVSNEDAQVSTDVAIPYYNADGEGDKSARRKRNLSNPFIPKTGDSTNIIPYIAILVSVILILIFLIKKRREKE